MPDPTGRRISRDKWACQICNTVNDFDRERCAGCGRTVQPPADEPIRPLDPLDVIGHNGDREVIVHREEHEAAAPDEGRGDVPS